MSKLVFTASLLAVLAIAACSPAAGGPTAVPSVPPSPSAPPSMDPPAERSARRPRADAHRRAARPAPDPTAAPETPDPAIVEFTEGEYLFRWHPARRHGLRAGPRQAPEGCGAEIECLGEDRSSLASATTSSRTTRRCSSTTSRGCGPRACRRRGSCFDGEGEGAYIPGDEEAASRQGCFITAEGVADYRLTLPGAHVYIGIVGHNIDTIELQDFAFRATGTPELPDPVATRTAERTARHCGPGRRSWAARFCLVRSTS